MLDELSARSDPRQWGERPLELDGQSTMRLDTSDACDAAIAVANPSGAPAASDVICGTVALVSLMETAIASGGA